MCIRDSNRSFFYPSISAGFILTELDALKNNVVNHAKLRVSYAEVGQAGDFLENYYSTPTYGGGFYTLTPIMYPMKGTTAYTCLLYTSSGQLLVYLST